MKPKYRVGDVLFKFVVDGNQFNATEKEYLIVTIKIVSILVTLTARSKKAKYTRYLAKIYKFGDEGIYEDYIVVWEDDVCDTFEKALITAKTNRKWVTTIGITA